MRKELAPLLLDLKGLTLEQATELTKATWDKEYMTKQTHLGEIGVWHCHDGLEVIFYENSFGHAFYKSKNQNVYPDDKSVFDLERAIRIRWIKETIKCVLDSIECWACPGFVGDCDFNQRIYVEWEDGYVIWMKKRKQGGFKFITAYNAHRELIRNKYIRGCKKVKK